jgi:hypothetical protein
MQNFKCYETDIDFMNIQVTKEVDHVDRETFLKEFFGNFGRDLGSPLQYFTNNPSDIISYIEENDKKKFPSFISTQPRKAYHVIAGLEKVALDFDYFDKRYKNKIDPDEKTKVKLIKKDIPIDEGLREEAKLWGLKELVKEKEEINEETKKLIIDTILSKRQKECEVEVISFVKWLRYTKRYMPMVVETRKGYHVYIYLDKVYAISDDINVNRETFRCLTNRVIQNYEDNKQTKLKYVDENVRKDVFRIMRIISSIHEQTGKPVSLVMLQNDKFVPDKYRHISFYKMMGLKEPDIIEAFNEAQKVLEKKAEILLKIDEKNKKSQAEGKVFNSEIRPCFTKALEDGEMPMFMRLAFLMEAYYAKKSSEEMLKMLSSLSDFIYDKSKYYVEYFLGRTDKDEFRPWSCKTLQKYNYCIENSTCPIWDKKYKNIKDGGK